MAASSIQITQGSGTRLATDSYTEGGVTVHNERVGMGEGILPTYTIVAGNTSTATVDSHLIQIMAGASLRVRIRRIEMIQDGLASTAALLETRLYRLTTAGTGGSTNTPRPLDPADAAAGATSMSLPTAKGTEGVLLAISKPYMIQTIGASTPVTVPTLVWDFDNPRSGPLIIAAGTANGIAIKNSNAVAGAGVMFTIWIAESSY